jgi:hypothetical protein
MPRSPNDPAWQPDRGNRQDSGRPADQKPRQPPVEPPPTKQK